MSTERLRHVSSTADVVFRPALNTKCAKTGDSANLGLSTFVIVEAPPFTMYDLEFVP